MRYVLYIVAALVAIGFPIGMEILYRWDNSTGSINTSIETKIPEKVEYELELMNQDSVRIKSLLTGREYKVRSEEIQDVLSRDNL